MDWALRGQHSSHLGIENTFRIPKTFSLSEGTKPREKKKMAGGEGANENHEIGKTSGKGGRHHKTGNKKIFGCQVAHNPCRRTKVGRDT